MGEGVDVALSVIIGWALAKKVFEALLRKGCSVIFNSCLNKQEHPRFSILPAEIKVSYTKD